MKTYPNLISAEIVADSKAPTGERITTFKLVMPRYILAEFNTHRLFSRNSASSRAIPLKKMINQVKKTPFIPMAFQKDHSGMQGVEYITDKESLEGIQDLWLGARDYAVLSAEALNSGENSSGKIDNKVTKQLCNRLLEPFLYHTVLITATEWENFFELRCPKYEVPGVRIEEDGELVDIPSEYFKSKKDLLKRFPHLKNTYHTTEDWLIINHGAGEIHIMDLAEKMWDAMNDSTPKELKEGDWHIPFGDNFDKKYISDIWLSGKYEQVGGHLGIKIKVATARCARISYETLGDNPKIDYEADIKLHDILLKSGHMSPFEHCAKAMSHKEYMSHIKASDFNPFAKDLEDEQFGWSRNFKGFIQYRELVESNE